MILVLGFEQSETASLEAASGRHKKVMSEALMHSARAAGSLRLSSSIRISSMSLRPENRSYILRPVVPSFPSMKIL